MDAENQDAERPFADEKQLARLKKDVRQWNSWREYHPDTPIQLAGVNLEIANLGDADLREADLRVASLRGAYLEGANLEGATLEDANFEEANLRRANLGGADLRSVNLGGADLREANLGRTNLEESNLKGADWTCPEKVPDTYIIYAAILSNARGLLPANVECLRRGL
jgi:hypothetical protein